MLTIVAGYSHDMAGVIDIVFNPASGLGRASGIVERLVETLLARNFTPRAITIADFFAAPEIRSCDVVLTLGGDGTVRAIVEALAARFGADAPPVAVVPLGTANLVAKHLKLPWSADAHWSDLCDALAARRTRAVDVASANGKVFLLMCSVGFDAQVVHEVAARRKGPITMLDYLPAFGRSVLNMHASPLTVSVDGKRVFGPAPGLVVVANAAEYGTGFSMNPNAASDDGVLDVTVCRAGAPLHLVRTALHAVTGTLDHDAVVTTGHEIEIAGNDSPAQIDGEAFGTTPISIRLLPFRQRFIVAAT